MTGSGLAYTADDDCRFLEEQMREGQSPIVSVAHKRRTPSTVKSQFSWERVEQALVDAGVIREGETIAIFDATHDGLKITFGE